MKKLIRIFLIVSVVGICGSSVALITPSELDISDSACASGYPRKMATFDMSCLSLSSGKSYSVSARVLVCNNSSDNTLFKMTLNDAANNQDKKTYAVDSLTDLCDQNAILQVTANAYNPDNPGSCSIEPNSLNCNPY